MQNNKLVELDDREHILLRGNMYLGAIDLTTKEGFYLEDDKIVYTSKSYVPGLIKIINEVIDNAVDEAIRTNFKFANNIKVCINQDTNMISVEDNGRGIPQELTEVSGLPGPVAAWGKAKAGGNFEDSNRITIGANGVGSYITNCWSKEFTGITANGSTRFAVKFTNNAESYTTKVNKFSGQGTMVKFVPDLEKFGLSSIDDVHVSIIKQRIFELSVVFPEIKFTFNGKVISFRNKKQYLDLFGSNYEVLDLKEKGFVGIFPNESDDLKFHSLVNGLVLHSGGNHIDYLLENIVKEIKDKISRKYKSIKPADIKNKLLIVTVLNDFNNLKFDSQTKERLTNSYSEIRNYLGDIDLQNFSLKIYKNKEIIDPITEMYRIKEEFKKRKDLENIGTGRKRIKNDKYYPAIKRNKYLVLAEGNSASNGIMSVLGREELGYFPLRGKPLNVIDADSEKITANQEIKDIIQILNIKIGSEINNPSYENVLIASDQDLDGIHIRALLITFFNSFCPNLIKEGKIKILNTPLIAGKKGNRIEKYFFNLEDYKSFVDIPENKNGYSWTYYKGLSTWKKEDLTDLIKRIGLENMIVTLKCDDNIDLSIKNWMGKLNSDFRKDNIRDLKFDISLV
jgi:DNA topoisomerase-2